MNMTENFFAIAQVAHEVTLWLLIVLSILSLAFILERFFTLGRTRRESGRIAERVREVLQSNNLSELEDLSKDRNALEGRALSYGLRHVREKGAVGLEEIFSSFAAIERPALERYLGFLATVGSNAPFVGLLGTVFGIMDAFRGLATSQGDATAVMVGISKALVATAIGLMVAIPAVIAYNYFQKQVKATLLNLQSVRDLCVAYAKSGPVKKG
ncbi:MAG: MotA/TolQ/ExbB proton channel family protein [Bdellovibrionales bacterium]